MREKTMLLTDRTLQEYGRHRIATVKLPVPDGDMRYTIDFMGLEPPVGAAWVRCQQEAAVVVFASTTIGEHRFPEDREIVRMDGRTTLDVILERRPKDYALRELIAR